MRRSGEGITEALARASAARPKRTLALWGGVVVAAVVFIATALHGLSSDAHVVGNPRSRQAAVAFGRAFPAATSQTSDVIVVRSDRYTADQAPFRRFVGDL